MRKEQYPLVSCIMPTYNRREFVPHAIRYFLQQEYENKELIIIDDGTDIIRDLVPDNQLIRYFYLEKKITLGAKLNLACTYASGSIIAHWDDDDWYAPRRLGYQVECLRSQDTEICGINHLLYYDIQGKKAFQYIYPSNQRVWLLGSSLCYKKELWQRQRFSDINVGMDGLFVWATPAGRVEVLPDNTISVHMIHDKNVSPKKTGGSWWHTYPVAEIKKIIGADWLFYANSETEREHLTGDEPRLQNFTANGEYRALKNVYACLVHEKKDCVIDLVCNLHYHDPSSVILLYNGGVNADLFQRGFPFDQFGAVIHPRPSPVKHGYLFNFAIDCMQFALENFAFDALTIVDSDQLAIRAGYPGYLGKFLFSQSNTGMLSSNPERVTRDNTTNKIAIQAFKEYDLWKPLLNSFPGGEKKFAYWTFWPSTVFTKDAATDLVKLIKQNTLLQDILKRTKIWASEEVILPTLVKLLGYEIVANPCGYDFVRYKKELTLPEVNCALNKKDIYWIHPVPRSYDDPTRSYVRQQNQEYGDETKNALNGAPFPPDLPDPVQLIRSIRKIEGWLSDKEAELLISTAIKVCKTMQWSSSQAIVEIGSYHGKSTILSGSIIKALLPGIKVYAIDPHDGKLGAADKGLQTFPPSFEMFKKNIVDAGISEVVEVIRDNAYNVKWDLPVSLLFIDGLHDYPNVARDFQHFSHWIIPGGYVAFHDYAEYFPGVMNFVNELLAGEKYRKTGQADSLIIVQKL